MRYSARPSTAEGHYYRLLCSNITIPRCCTGPPEQPSTIVKQPLCRDVAGKLHAANRTANAHSRARLH